MNVASLVLGAVALALSGQGYGLASADGPDEEVERSGGPSRAEHHAYTTETPWTGRTTPVTQSYTTAAGSGTRTGTREVDGLENVTLVSFGGYGRASSEARSGTLQGSSGV